MSNTNPLSEKDVAASIADFEVKRLLRTMLAGNTMQEEAGAGSSTGVGTILRSSVTKDNGVIKTSILIDLTGLASSTTDLDIIGVGTSPAHLGRVTVARSGTLFGGLMTCLEVPAGGVTDIDLYSANEGTGIFDGGIAALTETALITAGGAWTLALEKAIAQPAATDQYLYLTCGTLGTAATYTSGKFLIELYGYDA